jgi:hypothetical protein
MNTKKVLFKVASILLFLSMLSLTSCEALSTLFGCYYCTNGNGDSTSTCDDDEADQLRNSGWSCSGGW